MINLLYSLILKNIRKKYPSAIGPASLNLIFLELSI